MKKLLLIIATIASTTAFAQSNISGATLLGNPSKVYNIGDTVKVEISLFNDVAGTQTITIKLQKTASVSWSYAPKYSELTKSGANKYVFKTVTTAEQSGDISLYLDGKYFSSASYSVTNTTGLLDEYLAKESPKVVAVYDLNGQKIEASESTGIVIAVFSDGSKRKFLMQQ